MLKGKIKKIYSKDTFNIITLISGKQIQYIGNIEVHTNDYITCNGEWINTKYGQIFSASNITVSNSFYFLFSLFISGISDKTAEKIFEKYTYEEIKKNPLLLYDYFLTDSSRKILEQIREKRTLFYADTIDTISKHLAKEIKGIGKKKILNWIDIYTTYYEYNTEKFLSDNFLYYILSSETTRQIVQQVKYLDQLESDYKLLRKYDIPEYSLKYLIKDFKNQMLNKIKENVFMLNDYYVPFPLIDNFAIHELNMNLMNEKRIINGVIYELLENEKDGNTFMDLDSCLKISTELLNVSIEKIKEIIIENLKLGYDSEFILEENRLYRRVIYYTEQKLAKMILEKTEEKDNYIPYSIPQYLSTTNLSKNQQECIIGSLKKKISIFTGGPGTGKTTSIKELCNCLDKMNKTYILTSPTGKAAKRISESTDRDAKTIYRTLEYKKRGKFGSFQRNENYKLYANYIIVDESSMLDVFILNSLLKATHEKTSIIFVGDVNQLPSVSMGSVFKDMKDSEVVPIFELTEVFRQGLDSDIVQNAYHVKKNEPLQVQNKDFFFEKIKDLTDVEKWLKKLKSEFLIICPMRIGMLGTIKMNKIMQELKNKNSIICSHFDRNFKIGDKVIQLDNNYDKEVYNGEIGYIKSGDSQSITVCYPNNLENTEITYEYKELNQIDLAYAITIHKSQGSESNNVLMIVDGNKEFISKELIYTGITRAKEKLFILSTYDLDFYKNLQTANNRCTNLCNVLRNKKDGYY